MDKKKCSVLRNFRTLQLFQRMIVVNSQKLQAIRAQFGNYHTSTLQKEILLLPSLCSSPTSSIPDEALFANLQSLCVQPRLNCKHGALEYWIPFQLAGSCGAG